MIVIAKLVDLEAGEINLMEALAQIGDDEEEEIVIPDENVMKNGGMVQVQFCKVKIQKLVAINHEKMEFTAYHY